MVSHHWSSGIVPATPIAHKGIVAGAKAIAATMIDLILVPETLRAVKADFAKDTEGVTWQSLGPVGAKPPTHLNKEAMAKWRPLLESFYYDPNSKKTYLEQLGIAYPPQLASGLSTGN